MTSRVSRMATPWTIRVVTALRATGETLDLMSATLQIPGECEQVFGQWVCSHGFPSFMRGGCCNDNDFPQGKWQIVLGKRTVFWNTEVNECAPPYRITWSSNKDSECPNRRNVSFPPPTSPNVWLSLLAFQHQPRTVKATQSLATRCFASNRIFWL